MDNNIYDIHRETWSLSITSLDELESILEKWYTLIVGDVNLSWKNISTLTKLSKYKYSINWCFNLSNNNLTSFEWFPSWWVKILQLNWNKIRSFYGIPPMERFRLDNDFDKMEELIKWSIYKYGQDYFIIQNIYSKENKKEIIKWFHLLMKLDEQMKEHYGSTIDETILPAHKYTQYLIKDIYPHKISNLENKVKFNWKTYIKEILNPEFHKNWWNIDTLEIKYLKWDIFKINWKKFNKKLSKTLK